MTIATTVTSIQFAGNGAAYDFEFPAKVFDETDLIVQRQNPEGVWTLLTLNVDYSVTVSVRGIATVTLNSLLATGYALDIRSDTQLLQPTSIRSLTRYLPELHEDAFDRLTRQIQDLGRRIRGAFRYPDIGTEDGEIASVEVRKGKYLFFNAITGAAEYVVNIATTVLSQSLIAQLLNPQTPAEILAGVIPTNYFRREGDIRRYGAIANADSTTAITASLAQMQASGASVFVPTGTFLCGDLPDVDYVGWRVEGEDGVRSIIKFTGSGNGLVITANFGYMRGVGFYNGGTRSNGLICQNAGGSVFENVFAGGLAVGFASHGVLIDENFGGRPKGNNNAIKFNTCFSGRNGGCGYAITTVGLDQNAIEFNSCSANANTSHGLLLKGQANRVEFGIYEGNGGYGIQLSEASDSGVSTKSTILFPYIESNTLGGVRGGGKSTGNVVKLDGLNANSDYTRAAGSEDWVETAGSSSGPFLSLGDPTVQLLIRTITSGGNRLALAASGSSSDITTYLDGKGAGGVWLGAGNDTDGGLIRIGQHGTGIRNVLKGSATFGAVTSVAVSFGVTLPSANYQISLSPNAVNKAFGWSAKTTTGFTLNAASTSSDTVDWVVTQ